MIKKKKKLIFRIFIFSLIGLFLLYLMSETSTGFFRRRLGRYLARFKLESLDPLAKPGKDRILIIAPHPDDETISSAGIIQKAVQNGDEVRVVIVTNGDGFSDIFDETILVRLRKGSHGVDTGYKRQQESIHALRLLGLKRTDITFLGYPDNGIGKMWFENWSQPYYSQHTKAYSSPYDNSYTLGATHTGESMANDIKSILSIYHPTIIITPSYYDFHPDHRGSTNFVVSELEKMRKNNSQWVEQTKVYYYLVHYGQLRWPRPWGYRPTEPLAPPPGLSTMNLDWFHSPLTEKMVEAKKKAMDQYVSQVKLIGDYLFAFVRNEELFGIHYWNDSLMLDPSGDFISKDFLRGSDLISLKITKGTDQIKFTTEVSPKGIPGIITYRMRIVYYERRENGNIVETRDQFQLEPRKNSSFKGTTIETTVSTKAYPDLFAVYVTVEAFPRFSSLQIDKIPWSFFRLK